MKFIKSNYPSHQRINTAELLYYYPYDYQSGDNRISFKLKGTDIKWVFKSKEERDIILEKLDGALETQDISLIVSL